MAKIELIARPVEMEVGFRNINSVHTNIWRNIK